MRRLVLLDAGPLGLAANPRASEAGEACRDWIKRLMAGGAEVYIPEVADYEVRREALFNSLPAGSARWRSLLRFTTLEPSHAIYRLDALKARLAYLPITTDAMIRAAQYWALLRRQGLPTAADLRLDADAILAGQAATVGGRDDAVTIATANVRHLARFPGIDARDWATIAG